MHSDRSAAKRFEIAIVGGGPAGLAAAIAAGRMNRRAICFETGTPRSAHAPCYHNYLGFPDGIAGVDLLRLGGEQARRWGAVLRDARVTAVERDGEDPTRFVLETTAGRVRAAGIVFATGIEDRQLECGNLYGETRSGVHYCVICDGYETRGQRVAVVGRDDRAVDTVHALLDFTDDLHLLLDGEPERLDTGDRRRLLEWGVRVHAGALRGYRCDESGVRFDSDDDLDPFPHLFLALGVIPRTDVAAALGCALDEEKYIVTDEHQATSVPFVFAAGDCDGGHKQVTQAMAEGEMAALELAKKLREAGFHARGREYDGTWAAQGQQPA